ncbi:MAG: hypothetical protein DDT19_02252 [Syntrophomonadaceae bacterium]|nr:hypothetical protein [Bacillota bacterium]
MDVRTLLRLLTWEIIPVEKTALTINDFFPAKNVTKHNT